MSTNTISINERAAAWSLLILAIIFPPAISPFLSSSNVFDSGRLSGNIMGFVLLATIVTKVATNGRTVQVRNRAMLIVGILIFGYSLLATYRLYHDANAIRESVSRLADTIDGADTDIETSNINITSSVPIIFDTTEGNAAKFLDGMQSLLKRFTSKSVDLNNRMNALPLGEVLKPENLVSSEGIAQSKAILIQYKNLIAERQNNLDAYWVEVMGYFNDANVNKGVKSSAMNSFQRTQPEVKRLYGKLDKVQLRFAGEAEAIIDIAEINLGRIQVSNGQILFPEESLLDAYNTHIKILNILSNEEAIVTREITNLGQQQRDAVNKDLGQ